MTIKELLEKSTGYKFSDLLLTIKTTKKLIQVGPGKIWMHQVVLMDMTGEIWADVAVIKYEPLRRGNEINIVQGEIQDSQHLNKPCKKILVSQFTQPAQIGEPPMDFQYGDSVKTIRSKILCLQSAGMFDGACDLKVRVKEVNAALDMPEMARIVDKIMEG